ncbi:MAG: D-galactonate dehydratase, partial [Candidatus Latescibacterota bacterium]|nr:D-galactonate dehydratase [Candidatus Latescibacterota bacterium]
MRITDIDVLLINSPSRKWTIVQVFTDEGLVGLGEATYSNKEPVVVEAIRHMKGELIGEDPARIEFLWHKIYRQSSIGGIWRMAGPVWMSALSGIDQALWDIKGKVSGLPVVDLLGGRFRNSVEVYTHFWGNSTEESAASACRSAENGYTALKGSALSGDGYRFDQYLDDGRPKETAEHFAAVREAVGPDIKLLVDC